MRKPDKNSRFQTHIAEPRWQQVVSVVVILVLIALWIWLAFQHRSAK